MVKHNHEFANATQAKPAYIYARYSSLAQREVCHAQGRDTCHRLLPCGGGR